MKKCRRCNIDKNISEYHKHKSRKDGVSDICKDCAVIDNKIRRQRRLSKPKSNVLEKKCYRCSQIKSADCFWKAIDTNDGLRSSCIECEKKLASVADRKLKKSISRKIYNKNNSKHNNEYAKKYRKVKRKVDSRFRLRLNVSNVIREVVRNRKLFNCKIDRLNKYIFDNLPYSANELKNHLESLWEPWMNWDNYGKSDKNRKTWQIDHIIPQSKLPFESFADENFQKCWALNNLRPLEAIANMKKGNRV
jgi:hypothetical protein